MGHVLPEDSYIPLSRKSQGLIEILVGQRKEGKGEREKEIEGKSKTEGGRRWDTVIGCEPSRQPGERGT